MSSIFELNEEELNSFPDPNEYFHRLSKLDNYDFDCHSYEEIEKIFYEHAVILPSLIVKQPKEYYSELFLYRARLNIDNYDLELINTHSYPNSYFCQENGRCNLKGRSVFYCSDNPNAALYEINPKVGDTGYLSMWQIRSKESIKFTSLLPPELPNGNRWISFAKESNERNIIRWQSKYPKLVSSYKLLKAFVAEKFYTEKAPYYLSSFISNKLLYENSTNDMLIYRSVKVDGLYCNMAVHPNFVDEGLSLKKIVRFKINAINENTYNFSTGKVGEFNNGKIKWRNRNKDDEKDIFNYFSKEP